jgi:eukaryotic-like serine/threonine-protein kinase
VADRTTPLPSRDEDPGQLATSTGPRTTGRARSSAGSVGVLLDGRYRLLQRRTKDGAWATWDGEDDQLLRPVVVAVVSGPTASEAVDAARRSATLEDERLPHLLDVGLERAVDGTALGWVVTERSPGRTLAELLREAPLPSARARALVGEAAAVLARASRSGLHHRRLEPSAVTLTADGAVSVLGLEVASAAAGLPPRSPAEAEREDAEGLVRVLYAALTGLWPAGRCGALGAAPTGRGGSPVAPGDLAQGVPHDLDALCQAVLGPYREGPASPADVAAALAPWGSSTGPVTRTGLGLPVAPALGATALQGSSDAGAAGAVPGAWASAPARARLGGGPGLHFSADGASAERDGAGEPVVHATRAERRAAQRRAEREAERAAHGEDAFEALLGPVTGPRRQVPPVLDRAHGAAPAQGAEDSAGAPPTAPLDDDARRSAPPAPAQPTRRVEPDARRTQVASTAPGSSAAEPVATTRVAPPRRPREPQDDVERPARAVRRGGGPAAAATTAAFSDTDATDWVSAGWGHAPAGAEAVSAPRRARTGPERRRRGPLLAVLVVLVLVLVAAVLLLLPRATQIAGALGIAPSDTSAPGTTASAAPAPSAAGAAPGAAQEPASSGAAGEITAAQAQDPFGDSTENDESASRAVDGDPATAWRSSTYSNAALGNLKRGVGLGLVLGDGTTPSAVTALQLRTEGTGGRLEVRSSPDGGYEGSTVVATTTAGTGGADQEVTLDAPVEATHLLLWFTELPQTPTGYAAVVDEVSAR